MKKTLVRVIMFNEDNSPEQVMTQVNSLIEETETMTIRYFDMKVVAHNNQDLNHTQRLIYTLIFKDLIS